MGSPGRENDPGPRRSILGPSRGFQVNFLDPRVWTIIFPMFFPLTPIGHTCSLDSLDPGLVPGCNPDYGSHSGLWEPFRTMGALGPIIREGSLGPIIREGSLGPIIREVSLWARAQARGRALGGGARIPRH